MMTAVPPAATTSAAVWRPIPLLPPTTTNFCPENTGMAFARSGSSAYPSWSQFQFAFIFNRSFWLGGCAQFNCAVGFRFSRGESTVQLHQQHTQARICPYPTFAHSSQRGGSVKDDANTLRYGQPAEKLPSMRGPV